MATRISIDPVTRIEGHLRIELETDDSDRVAKAFASGTMVRGIERILVGRDPREAWAFAQRACGVCTLVHGLASVRAVEDALGIQVPRAAQVVRDLMAIQQFVHDHVMHFYHLHAFDWVDVSSALDADPSGTAALQQSISEWENNSADHFEAVQGRLRSILESDQPSVFAAGPWGHASYRLSPEANLLAAAHYFEALEWQRGATKIHTIFGGKNPHPNLVVGGVPSPIDLDGRTGVNSAALDIVADSIADMQRFVEQVHVPDALLVLGQYPEEADRGEGLGSFLTWGEFVDSSGELLIPRALIVDRDLGNLTTPDPTDADKMAEHVARSWYEYSSPGVRGLHPWKGETNLDYTGPEPPYETLDTSAAYSWLKAPRWDGRSVEVGPLARTLSLYASSTPLSQPTRQLVDASLQTLGHPFEAMFSTLGRTLARSLETKLLAGLMTDLLAELRSIADAGPVDTFNDERWDPTTWPRSAQGFGSMEAPRGALGHWVVIEGGRIANYQMVVPTTWNASPRDGDGNPGAYEAALVGILLDDTGVPLEALRTVHSFDPCMACAVH